MRPKVLECGKARYHGHVAKADDLAISAPHTGTQRKPKRCGAYSGESGR